MMDRNNFINEENLNENDSWDDVINSSDSDAKSEGKPKPKQTKAAVAKPQPKIASATQQSTGPGSTTVDGNLTVFRVIVPENVQPGQEWQVYAGSRIVRVKCPPGIKAGQSLQITVPADSSDGGSGSDGCMKTGGGGNMGVNSPNVQRVENGGNGPQAYMVSVPDHVIGGQKFPVTIQGQQLMVTCPSNSTPGNKVRIVPPPPPVDVTEGPQGPMGQPRPPKPPAGPKDEETQLFEVLVPQGVQAGAPFALIANGVRVIITCPGNAGPGQRIRFKLPLAGYDNEEHSNNTGSNAMMNRNDIIIEDDLNEQSH
jgi:hypothetical protein